eukprot:scaffold21794_cov47-Cyclotella_meneghiniana.AAC.6
MDVMRDCAPVVGWQFALSHDEKNQHKLSTEVHCNDATINQVRWIFWRRGGGLHRQIWPAIAVVGYQ